MTPYKYEEVKKALNFGAVDKLIISKKYDEAITKELKEIAERMGTTVEIVSTETEEGEQFYSIAGIGAILRFKV